MKGESFQKILGLLTGNGILNSKRAEWRRNRRFVQLAFHPDCIEVYTEMMTDITEEICRA